MGWSGGGSISITGISEDTGTPGDGVTNDTELTLTGTGTAGATVYILVDGVEVGSVVADADGNWSFTLPGSFADGTYDLTAETRMIHHKQGSRVDQSDSFSLTVDTTPPIAPASLDLAATSDTGGSDSDDITNDATPTISGTGETGATITLYAGTTVVGTAVVDGNGNWSITTSSLADGVHDLTATATDAAGNVSPASAPLTVTVDTAAPAQPPAPTLVDDAGEPDPDNTTDDTTPDFSGTAEAGSIVIILVDGIAVGETVTAGDGSWHYDWETDAYASAQPISDGQHSVTVTATDAAGNQSSASGALQFTIGTVTDTTTPTASSPDLVAGSDSGISDSDNLTNDSTATFRFQLDASVAAGDTIELLIDGTVNVLHDIDAADISAGYVDLTSTTLNAGSNTISARLSDSAGNTSLTGTLEVIYDGVAPIAPASLDLAATSDTGGSDSDDITNDATPTITGTGEAGATITLYAGATVVGTAVVDGNGNWSITTSSLADGVHDLTATATDAAGNVSPASATLMVTVDTTATAPASLDLAATSDTGGSDSDDITNDATPTITGTGEAGATITLYAGAAVVGTAVADENGDWSITTSALADGQHDLTATATDAAGNVSPASAPLTVTVDTAAPIAPASLDLADASDTGGSDSDDVTADATPTIIGTGEAGATITLYAGATVVGTAVVDGNGDWSITTSSLADGVHDLTATATDAAGNVSPASAPLMVTVDTAAPTAPQVDAVLMADGTVATGGVTDDATPEIQGTAEANTTVEVFLNGSSIGTTITDQYGNWSIVAAALSDAIYTVTAEATDLAGNISTLSGDFQLEVDAVADEPASSGGSIDASDDPLYVDQWHLKYLGALEAVWQDYGGWGVSIGVYDDGIDYTHPDLAANYDSSKHVWVNGEQLDPAPSDTVSAVHGTAVSGVIAAVDNAEGGVGVAPGGSLTGVNIFGGPADINSSDVSGFSEAIDQAWTFDVVNNSWGTLPNFNHENDPAMLAALAGFETAVLTGRGGLGTIVVKAAGNDYDSSQEFLNASRYTVTVAAHDEDGDASWYTNRGANLLVSAPSSGSSADEDDGILTTDKQGSDGYASGNYTYGFGGTSSAAPVVSGVVALMLEANPNLGARDVQTILAYSAHLLGINAPETAPVPADSDGDGTADTTVDFPVEFFDWFRTASDNWNGGGLHFSEDYGFGGVNAFNAVRMAEVWSLFGDPQTFGGAQNGGNEVIYAGASQTPGLAFDNSWVEASYTYAGPQMELEYVEVYVDFKAGGGLLDLYGNMEDVSIEIVSPSGTAVSLMQGSDGYDSTNNYLNPFQGMDSGGQVTWTYGVNAFRGEDITGNWTLRIVDISNDLYYDGGVLNEFRITYYGAEADDNDVYHYTDEVFAELALDGTRLTLTDSAGTDDWLNMAAMTGDLTVNLASDGNGGASSASGSFIQLTDGTMIENAVTGDGNDALTGNDADNQLAGRRGNDDYWGGLGSDLFIFYAGDGNDWIWDFEDGGGTEDVIALYGFDFTSTTDFQITDNNVDTLLDFGSGGSITLAGIADSAVIGDDDFIFL